MLDPLSTGFLPHVLVRSWNVFHGNTMPPTRRGHLREIVELATRDQPAVLCLQELPVWALPELEQWSGMDAHWLVARPPRRPAALAAWLTRRNNGLFRSGLAGQANAILVNRSLASRDLGGEQVSDLGRERRVVHAVRVDAIGIIGNLHATNAISLPGIAADELRRASAFLDTRAAPGEPRILAGDLNLVHPTLPGYENGGPGLDHILVAGTCAGPLGVWQPERRTLGSRLLSDHAPVDRLIGAT